MSLLIPSRYRAVIRVLPSGCWEWLGSLDKYGYGRVYPSGKKYLAHRYIYFLVRGVWPVEAHHRCENPACVRPHRKHVVSLTRKEHAAEHGPRGIAARHLARGTCVHGHAWTEENTLWVSDGQGKPKKKRCRLCYNLRRRRVA